MRVQTALIKPYSYYCLHKFVRTKRWILLPVWGFGGRGSGWWFTIFTPASLSFFRGWGEEVGRYVPEQCQTLKIINQTTYRHYTDPSCLPRFWCHRRHSWCARTRCLRTHTTCRAHWCWCRRRGSCPPASVCAQPVSQTPLSPPSCWPVLSSWAFLKQVKANLFFCAWTSGWSCFDPPLCWPVLSSWSFLKQVIANTVVIPSSVDAQLVSQIPLWVGLPLGWPVLSSWSFLKPGQG